MLEPETVENTRETRPSKHKTGVHMNSQTIVASTTDSGSQTKN